MAYNKFMWWRGDMKAPRPLSDKHSLEDKIKHGDFDYPHYFDAQIDKVQREINLMEVTIREELKRSSELAIEEAIRLRTKVKRLKIVKLREEQWEKENNLLLKFRLALKATFGFDIWDEVMETFDGSCLELYNLYKNIKYERSH